MSIIKNSDFFLLMIMSTVGSSSSWWCSRTRGRIISWVNHKTTALDLSKYQFQNLGEGWGQLKHLHYKKIKTREQLEKNALPNLFWKINVFLIFSFLRPNFYLEMFTVPPQQRIKRMYSSFGMFPNRGDVL